MCKKYVLDQVWANFHRLEGGGIAINFNFARIL